MIKINFLHIPKTAGLSFYYFLEECFGKENCIRFGNKQDVISFHKNETFDYSKYSVVSGHISLVDFDSRGLIDNLHTTIVFLRDPFEREVSAFKQYWKSIGHDISDLSTQELDSFFRSSELNPSQKSYLNMESFHGKNIFLFPVNYLPIVCHVIKSALNSNYFPLKKQNVSLMEFDECKKEFILEYITNYVTRYRQDDHVLFNEVAQKADKTLAEFIGSLGVDVNF